MSQTIEVDVVTLGRYRSQPGKRDFVYAGDMVSTKNPMRTLCIGALLDITMGEDSKLKASVHLRPIGGGGKYEGMPKFLQENKDSVVLLTTKTTLFLMERESAEELEKLGVSF